MQVGIRRSVVVTGATMTASSTGMARSRVTIRAGRALPERSSLNNQRSPWCTNPTRLVLRPGLRVEERLSAHASCGEVFLRLRERQIAADDLVAHSGPTQGIAHPRDRETDGFGPVGGEASKHQLVEGGNLLVVEPRRDGRPAGHGSIVYQT